MARLELTAKELAEKLGVSIGTFRNQYANNLERINKRLEVVGESFRVVEKKRVGKHVYFILSDAHECNSSAEDTSIADISEPIPPLIEEAGSPPPASSFSIDWLDEWEREVFLALPEKTKIEVAKKLKVVKTALDKGSSFVSEEVGVSKSTVHRWINVFRDAGVIGLVRVKKSKRYDEKVKEILDFASSLYFDPRQLTLKNIYRKYLIPRMAELGVFVTYETVRKHVKETEKRNKWVATMKREGRSAGIRFAPRVGQKKEYVKLPNQRWEWDNTQLDLFCTMPGVSKAFRPWISMIRDVHSNYIVGYLISPKSITSYDVAKMAIEAFRNYGLPEVIREDWGKEFNAERIERGLRMLGIHISHAEPYSGWQKGNVEGGFRILNEQCLKFLKGYAIQNKHLRKEYEREHGKEAIPYEKALEEIENYIRNYNLEREHLFRPEERKGFDDPILYLAFAPRVKRKVTKATVQVENILFYPAPEDLQKLASYENQEVWVYLDEDNAGRAFVTTLEGELICEVRSDKKGKLKDYRRARRTLAKLQKEAINVQEKIKKTIEDLHESEKTGTEITKLERLIQEEQTETEEVREQSQPSTVEFPPTFDDYEHVQTILEFLKEGRADSIPEWAWEKLEEIKRADADVGIYALELEEIEKLTKGVRQ